MNIAIVTTEFVTDKHFDGGLANYTYKFAKWLLLKNHHVTVFMPSKEESNCTDSAFEGIPIVNVTIKDFSWLVKYHLKRLKLGFLLSEKMKFRMKFRQNSILINRAVAAKHRTSKFSIVHYPHLGGLAYDCPSCIPCVVRLSSSTLDCQKMGGYGSSDLQVKVQAAFEDKAMKKANAVFGPSHTIAAMTGKRINKEIAVFETPFEDKMTDLDCSVYEKNLKSKRYVLFYGSIGLIKGVGTIANMIHSLLDNHPQLHFVFVGKQLGNTINGVDLWDYLLKMGGSHSNRIVYLPSQRHPSLFPIVMNADHVVLPSRIDNFPNTCIESMFLGKIVIGTTGNGFDQLIDDGLSGYLTEVDSAAGLLSKIEHVLNMTPQEKIDMGLRAKKRIEKLHPDLVLNQLLQFYSTVINKHKN